MARKVTDILLVSSPYEAFIMEEEGRLAERIIHEYRGLNLSRPPMLTWVSTSSEALEALGRKKFDLVITMPPAARSGEDRLLPARLPAVGRRDLEVPVRPARRPHAAAGARTIQFD